jgi:RsmE family RNA methyltransferase
VNIVLVEPHELESGAVELRDRRAAHIHDTLRGVPGQHIRIGLLDGPLGVGTIASSSPQSVTLTCVFDRQPPPRPPVDVLLALPRPKVMRRLWAQLAALGVDRIMLTNAERVERPYFDTHVLHPGTYRPLLIEGLQQARDTRLPRVSIHRQFRVLVEDELDALSPASSRLVAHQGVGPSLLASVTADPAVRWLIAIGPEGGWNRFEVMLLEAHGFRAVDLGSRTLRTDTACVATLSLLHAAIADRVPATRAAG